MMKEYEGLEDDEATGMPEAPNSPQMVGIERFVVKKDDRHDSNPSSFGLSLNRNLKFPGVKELK